MLLQITTTHTPATDLSFLLHKHPDKLQAVDLSYGTVHIFYPEATAERCTAALLLEIDPIGLVRNAQHHTPEMFSLGQYVNDRPYVASSFLSVAITKTLSTALNGTCKARPELVDTVMPFTVAISVLPARGGDKLIRRLFEPLGYTVALQALELDPAFAGWGMSKYFSVTLNNNTTLKALLSHLYVLVPVLDNEKHYWVNREEVEKLLAKGEGWLKDHPEKEQITRRYLRNISGLARTALSRMVEEEGDAADDTEEPVVDIAKETLHTQRLNAVAAELVASGAKRVLDLGCGEGKLLKLLLREKQFTYMLGVDVSYRSIVLAMKRLQFDDMPPLKRQRIDLVQGSLTYRDQRLHGYDAAAIVEVIEHLDLDRLQAFERVVFESARPGTVVLTTPNREYNVVYESMDADQFRHTDHRFEWTRAEFETWAATVAERYGYTVQYKPIGEEHETVGAPSQMGIFTRLDAVAATIETE